MKHLLTKISAVLCALTICAAAFAQSAPKATGSVAFDFYGGVANVEFNVHDAVVDKGWMNWSTVGGLYPHMFGGPVVDAVVDPIAGTATFDVLVAYSIAPEPSVWNGAEQFLGGTIRITVYDGGTPGLAGDTLSYLWVDRPGGSYGPANITMGNLVVHK